MFFCAAQKQCVLQAGQTPALGRNEVAILSVGLLHLSCLIACYSSRNSLLGGRWDNRQTEMCIKNPHHRAM